MEEYPINGGLFHKSVKTGRAGAHISIAPNKLVAQTVEFGQFEMSLNHATVSLGGASGKMLFFRDSNQELTLFTESQELLKELLEVSHGPLHNQLRPIEATLKRQPLVKAVFGFTVIGLAILLFFAGQTLLGHGVVRWVHLIPQSVDVKIGKLATRHMTQAGPEITSDRIREGLGQIITRLTENSFSDTPYAFELTLVDNPQANAFALPGGQIVLFSGLIMNSNTAAEVAGVLAHEISHVSERHGLIRILQSAGIIITIQLFLGDVTGMLALVKEMFTLTAINHYSREQESAADLVAVRLMHESHLPPTALADFLRLLENKNSSPRANQESESSPSSHTGSVDLLAWLKTHPNSAERIRSIESAAAKLPETIVEPLQLDWQSLKEEISAVKLPKQDAKQ